MATAEPETFSIFGTPHDQPRQHITDITQLEPGDHIAFGKYMPNTFMGTHAIVERVDYEGRKLQIIYFKQSVFYGSVVSEWLEIGGQMIICKLLYQIPGNCIPAEDVVEYARSGIGTSYSILTGGYFVPSCKTGEGWYERRKEESTAKGNEPENSGAENGDPTDGVQEQPQGDVDPAPEDGNDCSEAPRSQATPNIDIPLESTVPGIASLAGKATMTAARVTSKAAKKAGSLGVVGAALELGSAIIDTNKIMKLRKENVMSKRQSEDAMGTRWTVAAGSTAGPLLGAAKGAAVGAALAGPAAPLGALIGSVIGGVSGLLVGTGLSVGLSQVGVGVRKALEEDLGATNREPEDSTDQSPNQASNNHGPECAMDEEQAQKENGQTEPKHAVNGVDSKSNDAEKEETTMCNKDEGHQEEYENSPATESGGATNIVDEDTETEPEADTKKAETSVEVQKDNAQTEPEHAVNGIYIKSNDAKKKKVPTATLR